jgi:hypothetical protein
MVMEHALIRGRAGHPAVLSDHVLVGPHAHVNGAEIAADAFLATGAPVFPGTVFGLPREEATGERIAARYAEVFGRHRDDRIIED